MVALPRWQAVLPEGDDGGAIESPPRRRSPVTEVPALVVAALLIAFLVKTFVAQAFYIPSGSMIPTLEVGDRVVVSRVAYHLHPPRRGDVVVFVAPASEVPRTPDHSSWPVRVARDFVQTVGLAQPSDTDFIKRVIGLPGETVEGRGGHIYVDGEELVEPYLTGLSLPDFAPYTVPPDHLWVMGDNRDHSSDSRVFKAIPESSIIGRAIARVWPPGRVGFL